MKPSIPWNSPEGRHLQSVRGGYTLLKSKTTQDGSPPKRKRTAWVPLIGALASTYFAATGGETATWIVAGIFWLAFAVFSKK